MLIDNYYEYINEESIDKILICNICQKPFIQPVITPCSNTYCLQCLEQSMNDNDIKCSSCGESHLKKDLIPFNDPSILTLLNKIQVKCILCEQVNIERNDFQNHIYQICPKAIITCSANKNNCPWIGLREELQTHLNTCSYVSDIFKNEEKHGEFLPFETVHLQQQHFQNQDIAIAVKALLINKRCKSLDLFNKGISAEGASIIASVLDNDTLLETLSFRNNFICDSGVQYLSHALSINSYLKRLDLNGNSITDIGIRLLADMLKTNKTLIKLTLSFNRISNEGLDILVDVFSNYNTTLNWLCLAGNSTIDDASICSIVNLIRHNHSLQTINLEDCNLSRWSKRQIYFFQIMYFKTKLNLIL